MPPCRARSRRVAAAVEGFGCAGAKPGPYPEPSGTIRTPHLHFDLAHDDYRLVTQMYFPGESLNESDILLSTLAARRRNPATVICRPAETSEPGVLAYTFDIVMLA